MMMAWRWFRCRKAIYGPEPIMEQREVYSGMALPSMIQSKKTSHNELRFLTIFLNTRFNYKLILIIEIKLFLKKNGLEPCMEYSLNIYFVQVK